MALAHDLAEAIVGDITPHDPIPKTEKHRMEEVQVLTVFAPR
jgi:putative hydrolase of HD superfamily